jgi:hypothetical protein
VLSLDPANKKSLPLQNLLLQSEALASTPWNQITGTGGAITRTNNSLQSPDGSNTATLINVSTFASGSSIYQDIDSPGTASYVASVYMKPGTMTGNITLAVFYLTGGTTQGFNAVFNPQTGSFVSTTGIYGISENVGNGWFKLSLSMTGTNALNTRLRFQIYASSSGIIYYWGAQLRRPYAPSTYIKTESSTIDFGNTIKDMSNNGNNLTLNSTITYDANNLGNLLVDGITVTPAFRSTTTGLPTDQDSTILCWARPFTPQPNPNTYTGLLGWGFRNSAGSPSTARALGLNTNNPSTFFVSSAYWGNDYVPNNANVTAIANQWNLIGMISRAKATTNNTTLFKFNSAGYGSITGNSSNAARTLNTAQQDLVVGSLEAGGTRMLNGNIGLVFIYNRELSEQEIKQNFNALRGRYGI